MNCLNVEKIFGKAKKKFQGIMQLKHSFVKNLEQKNKNFQILLKNYISFETLLSYISDNLEPKDTRNFFLI